MSFVRPAPAKSYSVAKVNKMLGRVYSIALLAIATEAMVNGVGELIFLNTWVFWISAALVAIAVLGVIVSQWFAPSAGNFWLRVIALLALAVLITWPLHFDPTQATPSTFQPWIWWLLGIATVAAGTTFKFSAGIAYLLVMALSWPLLKISGFGGSAEPLLAIQESLHLFVFSSVLIAMVLALRWEAAKADSANQEAIALAVESASVNAVEIERSRLDALVHDSVLTTLLIASRAQSTDQQAVASKLAIDAIASLRQARVGNPKSTRVTLASFFGALELKVKQVAPELEVTADRLNDLPVPSEIAQALTEATLQAVDNSLKHAGRVSERSVRLRGQGSGLKIVISDNGRGFRPSQVPRDRIGISSSIVSRVKNVGGRVFINASPGVGTTVIIEWGTDD